MQKSLRFMRAMSRKKHRILNTELSIRADKARTQYPAVRDDVAARSRLLEQVLLYDRVHLVTRNFLIVPLLVEWAGMQNVLRLLRDHRLGFTRPKGFIEYDGKHKGVEYFIFLPRFTGDFDKDWLKIADTADIPKAVRTVLIKTLSNHQDETLSELESLVIKNAKPVDYPKIGEAIHEETEADFLDEEIRDKLMIQSKDIASACDIAPNQMKIGFDDGVFDPRRSREIDKALAIGLTNFDLITAKAVGDVDIHTDNISQLILEAKLRRDLKSKLIDEGFRTLLRFRRIPDFPNLVETGQLHFDNIFDLMGTAEHLRFVGWLHDLEMTSADDALRDYIDKLEKRSGINSLKFKTVRFLATAGLGILVPAASVLASAIDSFIVGSILKGWHPKLFLDKLRSTIGR